MSAIDAEALAKIAATGFAAMFAGGAAYITIVQHPAVEATDDMALQVSFFHEMYPRAARWQASSAVVSGASSLAVYYLQTHKSPLWLYSGALIFAIVPYTVATMLPLNNRLMDSKASLAHGKTWVNASLRRWINLHNVRTAASVVALTGMIVALATPSHSSSTAI